MSTWLPMHSMIALQVIGFVCLNECVCNVINACPPSLLPVPDLARCHVAPVARFCRRAAKQRQVWRGRGRGRPSESALLAYLTLADHTAHINQKTHHKQTHTKQKQQYTNKNVPNKRKMQTLSSTTCTYLHKERKRKYLLVFMVLMDG